MAKLVAENVKENPSLFEETVQMWVFEEEYTIPKDSPHYSGSDKPEKLSQLINRGSRERQIPPEHHASFECGRQPRPTRFLQGLYDAHLRTPASIHCAVEPAAGRQDSPLRTSYLLHKGRGRQ